MAPEEQEPHCLWSPHRSGNVPQAVVLLRYGQVKRQLKGCVLLQQWGVGGGEKVDVVHRLRTREGR